MMLRAATDVPPIVFPEAPDTNTPMRFPKTPSWPAVVPVGSSPMIFPSTTLPSLCSVTPLRLKASITSPRIVLLIDAFSLKGVTLQSDGNVVALQRYPFENKGVDYQSADCA